MLEKVSARECSVTVHGLRYAYKAWGESSNPAILACHGWLDNAASFDILAPYLSDDYYLIAIDMMGHGYSDTLGEGRFYHYVDMLADLVAVLDALSMETVFLIGHSLGGALVTILSAVISQRVKACVTIDALGPLVTEPEKLADKMFSALQYRAQWAYKQKPVYASFEEAVMARQGGGFSMPEQALQLICGRGLHAVENGWTWLTDLRLRTPSMFSFTELQIQSLLSKVRCSVLLIKASQGLLQRMPSLFLRMRCLCDLTVDTFIGGHYVHMEQEVQAIAACIKKHFLLSKQP